MLSFFVFLHSSFPLFFSVLVSASPVLVCTAVLLGTLLSYGEPMIPEIEESTTYDITVSKPGFSGDNVMFERSDVSGNRWGTGEDVEEMTVKEYSLVSNEINTIDDYYSSTQLVEEMSWMVKSGESDMFEDIYGDERTLGNQYSLIMDVDDEQLDLENAISPVGSIDSKAVNTDVLHFPPELPWKYANEEDVENNDDDLGSGRDESSAPGASMTDIIPMLDELHPLLYELAPQQADLYHDGSNVASGRSDESSIVSDDDCEHHEESEIADDGNEETCGVEGDQTMSAITWTEADQKNLKDLGTSELEKNQRLENLIARQRARKTMRMMTEKNLIDFDDTNLSFNVPPIWTKRTNPFDLSQESYENMDSPPIPGSAPSILLPQRNPFALANDSNEENPDLEEDRFEQEFVPFQSKVPIFCRHESFNIRPSFFGTSEREKQDVSWFRNYLFSERLGSEGRNHSTLTRQSSEVSDSMQSYAPDVDSIGSAGYLEELALSEEEPYMKKVRTDAEEDIIQEPEIIPTMGDTSELVGHGSESSDCSDSEDDSMEFGHVKKTHMIVDEIDMKLAVEYHQETDISKQRFANWMGTSLTESHSNYEALEQRDSGPSSLSTLSEESENICIQAEAEEFPGFTEGKNDSQESTNCMMLSTEGCNLKITTLLTDDTPQKDPIYDSSPPAFMKNLSSLSVSSGPQDELEKVLLPILVKRSVSFSERVTDLGSRNMNRSNFLREEMLDVSSGMIPVNKSEIKLEVDAPLIRQYSTLNNVETSIGFSLINSLDEEMSEENNENSDLSDSETTSVPAQDSSHILVDVNSSGNGVMKENIKYKGFSPQLARRFSTDSNATLLNLKEQPLDRSMEELNSCDTRAALSMSMMSNEQYLDGSGEKLKAEHVEQVSPVVPSTPPAVTLSTDLITEVELIHPNIDNSFNQDEKLTSPIHQNYMPEDIYFLYDGLLAPVEKTIDQPLHEISEKPMNSSSHLVEVVHDVRTADNLNNHNSLMLEDEVLADLAASASVQPVIVPFEMNLPLMPPVGAYDIKEINDELPSELDILGGFHIEEFSKASCYVEYGDQVSHLQHDSERSAKHDEGAPVAAHEAKHEGCINDLSKDSDNLINISKFETSGSSFVRQINLMQQ